MGDAAKLTFVSGVASPFVLLLFGCINFINHIASGKPL
jgi:hypothetical protein